MHRIYPYFEDSNSKYFYAHNWGDCPSGCITWNVYYVEIIGDSVIQHDNQENIWYSSEAPPWVDTFEVAYKKWASYKQ